jgi:hypothetical protein
MTFDPKSLLTAPPMTVRSLADDLRRLIEIGMGDTPVMMPDGSALNILDLVAIGEVPAHFVLRGGAPPATFQRTIK